VYLKLSNSGDNTFTDVGGLVEILRQRYFINHSSEAKTFINEEYTLISKTSDSLSITAKPIITNDLELIYSFKPQAKIVTFPIIIILLLSMSAFFLIIIQDCFTNPLCVLPNEENMIQILNKKVEISVGIIAASLIIPGLIKNPEIRHSLKWGFFLPVILALTALFA